MTSRRGPNRLLTLAVAATAVLAACGGSDSPAAENSAPVSDAPSSTVTEPVRTEPAVTEPARTEPAVTEPARTEPVSTEPSVTEPPATDAPALEPAETDPPNTDPPPATDAPSGQVNIPFVAPSTFDPEVDPPICLDNVDEVSSAEWAIRSCDEPHNAELVALATPEFAVMPDNAADGSVALRQLCGPLVAAYTGQDLTAPGIGVGFDSPNGLGDDVVAPVSCLASIQAPALVGSFRDLTIAEALGDVQILAQLEPGACFEFAGASFTFGYEIDCSVDGAIMAVGTYEMQDRAMYPDDLDVLREERDVVCGELFVASGLAGDPSTVSGTFAPRNEYLANGQRTATCDVTPI